MKQVVESNFLTFSNLDLVALFFQRFFYYAFRHIISRYLNNSFFLCIQQLQFLRFLHILDR